MGLFGPKWERAKKKAEKAQENHDYVNAYLFFTEALEDAPDGAAGSLEEGRDEAANKIHLLNIDEGEQALEANRYTQAIDHFRLAVRYATDKLRKSNAEELLDAAEVAKSDAEIAAAQDAAKRAAKSDLHADDVPKDDDAARQHEFQFLLSEFPEDYADIYDEQSTDFRDAFLARQNGDAAQALPALEAAAKEDTENPVVLFELGRTLRDLGRNKEALVVLVKAEELASDWIDVNLALAGVCWALKRWPLAEETLQRALELDDENNEVYVAVCRTALLTKQPEYGIEAAEVVLERDPIHRDINIYYGQLKTMVGDYDEAVEIFEGIIERTWAFDHQREQIIFDRDAGLLAATLYMRLNKELDRAEELLRAAITVTPRPFQWQYQMLMGEVQLMQDNTEAGNESLVQALHEVPATQRLARLRLFELLEREGDFADLLAKLPEEELALWEAAKEARTKLDE